MSRFRTMSVDTAAGGGAVSRADADTDRGLTAAATSTVRAEVAASAARSTPDTHSDAPDTAASCVDTGTPSLRVAALEAVNTAAATHRALNPKTISGTHRIPERRVPLINLKGHHGDYRAFV